MSPSVTGRGCRALLLLSTALGLVPADARAQTALGVVRAPAIVVADPGNPVTALDPADVNGIGQMTVDEGGGHVGVCTGTLINPRTVLFAAHCVNEDSPWSYGTGADQTHIAFSFNANNRAAQRSWLTPGAAYHQTDPAAAIYTVSQVAYHPDSLKLGEHAAFFQADVAVATLEQRARDVPTWTLLFSALPAPAAIDAVTGTGYHVAITGYGRSGMAETGGTRGIDFRRRVAENYLGLHGSIDDIDVALGYDPEGLAQNLYLIDFDDPRRGTPAASRVDMNLLKDQALPNEGTIAPGDSGGPLILDRRFAEKTVIGVLSGYIAFNGQRVGGYGSTAFYQPLYLFWDYIAANNPYRYAGAVAGDGRWDDAQHWRTLLDPAYRVIVDGALVNGVPSARGAGITGTAGKFGQVCDQEPQYGIDTCFDVGQRLFYVDGVARPDLAAPSTDLPERDVTLPAPTLANGLPGATGFVPDNVEPDAAAHRRALF